MVTVSGDGHSVDRYMLQGCHRPNDPTGNGINGRRPLAFLNGISSWRTMSVKPWRRVNCALSCRVMCWELLGKFNDFGVLRLRFVHGCVMVARFSLRLNHPPD